MHFRSCVLDRRDRDRDKVGDRKDWKQTTEIQLLAKASLSPPGRGYDCGRTWQALALGTVPQHGYNLLSCEIFTKRGTEETSCEIFDQLSKRLLLIELMPEKHIIVTQTQAVQNTRLSLPEPGQHRPSCDTKSCLLKETTTTSHWSRGSRLSNSGMDLVFCMSLD